MGQASDALRQDGFARAKVEARRNVLAAEVFNFGGICFSFVSMIIHRILAVIVVSLLSVAGAAAQTAPLPPPLDTTVPRAILMDARTGLVFFEKNADQLMEPASTSKLMTALLVFDAL